nr:radical SAM/SPASM domain-containing protein [uncultured Rhodoferax sp.]
MKINKADKPASGLLRRVRFHFTRGKGHLFAYTRSRLRWFLYPQLRFAGSYPDHVDLELSSACNMKCPMCYTTTEAFKKQVPHENLDFELFTRIIDQLVDNKVFSIRLSWRGEPTLNKNFLKCVSYAKERGIKEVSTLTNALKLSSEMFEALVDLQLDWLTISFDGTGDIYEQIRKPAKYNPMVEKIMGYAETKRRKGSVKPAIRIQGIWPAIQPNPDAYFETFDPIADEVSVNSLLDYLHKDGDIQYIKDFTCPVPFQRLVIGSDGRAFMCINDELGQVPVGDTRTQTIAEIWNGAPMQRVREVHKRGDGTKEFAPCKVCYQPRQTQQVPVQAGRRVIMLQELVGRTQEIGK